MITADFRYKLPFIRLFSLVAFLTGFGFMMIDLSLKFWRILYTATVLKYLKQILTITPLKLYKNITK